MSIRILFSRFRFSVSRSLPGEVSALRAGQETRSPHFPVHLAILPGPRPEGRRD